MSNRPAAADRLLTNPGFAIGLLRRSLNGNVLTGFALLLLAGNEVWEATRPDPTRYFASSPDHEPYPVLPLDRPVVDNPALLAWASEAVVKAYSLDFVRYRQQSEEAKVNFEPHAWNGWARSFIDARNLAKIVDAKMVTRAVPRSAPVVAHEGVVRGRYVWNVQFPMVLSYENTNGDVPETLLMEIMVARSDDPRHRRGIAIAQLVAKPWLGEKQPRAAAIR